MCFDFVCISALFVTTQEKENLGDNSGTGANEVERENVDNVAIDDHNVAGQKKLKRLKKKRKRNEKSKEKMSDIASISNRLAQMTVENQDLFDLLSPQSQAKCM